MAHGPLVLVVIGFLGGGGEGSFGFVFFLAGGIPVTSFHLHSTKLPTVV